MNYWLTTHWPPREGNSIDNTPDIWLPEGRQSPGAKISPHDLVLIYESLTGRTQVRRKPDGTQERIYCQRGRGGVICIGCIQASLTSDEESITETYVDGTNIRWRWHAPANVVSRSGFVPRQELATILGYDPSYSFRGFGEKHSGLRRLSEEEFNIIVKQFKMAQPINLQDYPIPQTSRNIGHSGGESDIHRALKKFVAADPSRAINEPGLTTLRVEYSFVTGDRADIVLVDQFNRIVGVEIEPEVTVINEAGPIQAIKYRYMLEWSSDRAPGDSRAILIAHKIDTETRKKCTKYNVECYEIPREKIKK